MERISATLSVLAFLQFYLKKGSDILSIALISFEDYSRYSVVKELKKTSPSGRFLQS